MEWIDVAMVALTACSVIAAITAVTRSSRANETASQALVVSKSANSLAAEANDHAKIANELSSAANRVASASFEITRGARPSAAWDAVISALAKLQTFDAASNNEPVGDHLTRLRESLTLLVDALRWPGFGTWVAREGQQGRAHLRAAIEWAQSESATGGLSIERIVQINEPFHTWVAAFTTNLRKFRADGQNDAVLAHLTNAAHTNARAVHFRNGWPRPTDDVPGLAPVDI